MALWEALSRLEEVVGEGQAFCWKGKAGRAGPHPTPEKPRGSWKGVENRWQGCQGAADTA